MKPINIEGCACTVGRMFGPGSAWVVKEPRTGLPVALASGTLKGAVNNAVQKILSIGGKEAFDGATQIKLTEIRNETQAPTLKPTIAADTPLIPEILADMVVREAGDLIEHVNAPAEVITRLCERAERHYQGAGGAAFARRIRSKSGREYLHAFMRHWLAAMLIERGVCRCSLPYEWGTGGKRPLDLNPKLKD